MKRVSYYPHIFKHQYVIIKLKQISDDYVQYKERKKNDFYNYHSYNNNNFFLEKSIVE